MFNAIVIIKFITFVNMYKTITILLIVNIVIVLPVYFYLYNLENDAIEKKLEDVGQQILNVTTENTININHELLRSAAVFSSNGIYVSNNSFFECLQYDNFVYKGNVQTFFWIVGIPYNETKQFEEYCSEYVYPNFTIKELDTATNTFIPVKPRPQYWPFVYFNPYLPQYEILIGYDASQTPWTLYLIYLAQFDLFASFRIDLASGIYKNPYSYGVIIGTGSHKNNTFIGGMYAIVHVRSLFQQSFTAKNLDNSDLDLFVFDVTEDGLANNTLLNLSLLYKNNIPENNRIWFANDVKTNFNTKRFEFKFVQRTWIVYFSFSDNYISKIRSNTYIIITLTIVAILILLDVIIATYVYFSRMYKKQLIIETMNKEIEKGKKDLATRTIAYVNHEVRNPLNVIKSLLELNLDQLKRFVGLNNPIEFELTKMTNDKESKDKNVSIPLTEMMTIISDYYTAIGSCNLVEHIVKDVLDLQKIEENKLVLVEKDVDIIEYITQFNKNIKQKINEKQKVKYEVNIDKNVQKIHTDPMRLTQILLNYFSNAIKFTDEGKIELNIRRFDEYIRFEVTDTGRGIKESDRPKVFKQFTQLDENDTTRYRGFGLGLYLCNTLATRMNGTVGYESKFGIGSKFWVQLKENGSGDNRNFDEKINQPLIEKEKVIAVKIEKS